MELMEERILTCVISTCFVIAATFIYFFLSILRQYRRNLILRKENSFVHVSAMEQERARIAADLHDEIVPSLALTRMKISTLSLQDEDRETRERLEETVEQLLLRLREISFDLMPAPLLNAGLFAAIRQLAKIIERNSSIEVSIQMNDEIDLPENITINLFRIVQEILHNAIKHSKATEILITFKIKRNLLQLGIIDDGIGFDYNDKLKNAVGLGLRNIQYRVQLLNGQMFVQSESGLTYIFEIPLN